MRLSFALILLLPSAAFAQTEDAVKAVERELAVKRTAKWVFEREAPGGGFYPGPVDPKGPKPQPSLRATGAAVRALKYLGFPPLKGERERHAAFVLGCFDPKTGAFAEPGGKPDVATTSVGVMAAVELGVPKEKFAKALDYLQANAVSFEEVRIAAAAVEAWGVKDCPFKLDGWFKAAADYAIDNITGTGDEARAVGSMTAMVLRLGMELKPAEVRNVTPMLADTQRADGGWGAKGNEKSDIETTYRVMRAFVLLKRQPKDAAKVRAFVAAHRNPDGGYATKPGDPSSVSGAYYAAILTKWLDEMEKK